jgi:hypothetical protein
MTNLETYFKNSQDIGPYIEQMQDNKDNAICLSIGRFIMASPHQSSVITNTLE